MLATYLDGSPIKAWAADLDIRANRQAQDRAELCLSISRSPRAFEADSRDCSGKHIRTLDSPVHWDKNRFFLQIYSPFLKDKKSRTSKLLCKSLVLAQVTLSVETPIAFSKINLRDLYR